MSPVRALRNRCVRLHRALRRGTRRRILLVPQDGLTAEYLGRFARTFEGDARLEWRVALGPPATRREAAVWTSPLPPDRTGFASARLRWWDLVVFASHGNVRRFAPEVPKLYVRHGMGGGKVIKGGEYTYNPRWILDAAGKPVYAAMLEPSVRERDRVLSAHPTLENRVAVVGDLRADEVLDWVPRREELRSKLGLEVGQRLLLIVTTWGEHSLLATLGRSLFQAALALDRSWRVAVSLHPRMWEASDRTGAWDRELLALRDRGVFVMGPGESNAPYLVAADVALFDTTSVSLTYALLRKPLVFGPVPAETVASGSNFARLLEASPRLEAGPNLARVLDAAGAGPPPELEAIAQDINSHPGEARRRTREAVLGLLGLDP